MFFTKLKEFLFGKPQNLTVQPTTEVVNTGERPVVEMSVIIDKPIEPEPIKDLAAVTEVSNTEEGHGNTMPETPVVQTPEVVTKASSANKGSGKKSNKTTTKPKAPRKPKSNTKPNQ